MHPRTTSTRQWLLPVLMWATIGAGCAATADEIVPATPGQHEAVVFDIDGTLTPKVSAIHTAREGAADAVQAFADAGYSIVYLSARMPLLQGGIRGWLKENGFPPGSLQLTENHEDRNDHAAFKQRVLVAYKAAGWRFIAAYGDSSTDFEAYAGAGIDPLRVFALKREGKDSCQPGVWAACYATWTEQMGLIADLVKAGT